MPIAIVALVVGFFGFVVLGAVVGCGWCSLCASARSVQKDFTDAWFLTIVCGMATTVVGLAVAHATGAVDVFATVR